MNIDIPDLEKAITKLLEKKFSIDVTKLVKEYLIWAEMSWIHTQWLLKLSWTEPLQNIPVTSDNIEIVHDTPLSQRINAHKFPAPYVWSIATQNAISKANDIWIWIIGIYNTFSSNGAQAYYLEKIAQKWYIWYMCSRSPSSTTWFGSKDPLFWTNPLWYSFPTQSDPLVFDAATSAITRYELVQAHMRWEDISKNLAIDNSWELTIDPQKAMNGAILPFDLWYKSAWLSMMVELFAGPMIGSSYIDNKTFKEDRWTLIIALDPNKLFGIDDILKHGTDLINKIKLSSTLPGKDIRLPWENRQKIYNISMERWYLEVDEYIYKEIFE